MENKDKDLLEWPHAFREVAFKLIGTLSLILSVYM